jgi:hypothetical protein
VINFIIFLTVIDIAKSEQTPDSLRYRGYSPWLLVLLVATIVCFYDPFIVFWIKSVDPIIVYAHVFLSELAKVLVILVAATVQKVFTFVIEAWNKTLVIKAASPVVVEDPFASHQSMVVPS